jgi:hypothetical protein
MMKRFIYIKWTGSDPQEPVELYYELVDGQGVSRSIEVFSDGSSVHNHYGPHEASLPVLEEINHDPQLRGSEITEEDFTTVWREFNPC